MSDSTHLYNMDAVAEIMSVPRRLFSDVDLIFLKDTVFVAEDGFIQLTGGSYSPHAINLILRYIAIRRGAAAGAAQVGPG